jgi:hypothetical protein
MRRQLVIGLLGLLLSASGIAQESTHDPSPDPCDVPVSLSRLRPHEDGNPVEVGVAVFILDVLDLDEADESFDVDFVYRFSWRDPRLSAAARGGSLEHCRLTLAEIWHPMLEPVNQRRPLHEREHDLDIDADGTVHVMGRMVGSFSVHLDLHQFPYDTQTLNIDVASFEYDPHQITFVVDSERTGRLDSAELAGWDILDTFTDTSANSLSGGGFEHARFVHRIEIQRQSQPFLWRSIIPLTFIVLMAWCVFWLDPEAAVPQRIGIATASVFALVAFTITLRNSLPPVAYLTRLDKFAVATTVLVFLALGEAVLTSKLVSKGYVEGSRKFDLIARWIYLLAVMVVFYVTLIAGRPESVV